MKKNLRTVASVRQDMQLLKGQKVNLQVCLGRKKTIKICGTLVGVYPSVFTVYVPNADHKEHSFSYTEILCGSVKVLPQNENLLGTN